MGVSTDGILAFGWPLAEDFEVNREEGVYDLNKQLNGAEIIYYCSYDYPMFFLCAEESQYVAWRGYTVAIESLEIQADWITNLMVAAKTLDLDITEPPKWHLMSMWG